MNLLDASLDTVKMGVEFYRQRRSAFRFSSGTTVVPNYGTSGPSPGKIFGMVRSHLPNANDSLARIGTRAAPQALPSSVAVQAVPKIQETSRKASRRNDGSHIGGNHSDDMQKANYVFQHFKDNRFSGDLRQSIQLTLRDYNVCARQHR